MFSHFITNKFFVGLNGANESEVKFDLIVPSNVEKKLSAITIPGQQKNVKSYINSWFKRGLSCWKRCRYPFFSIAWGCTAIVSVLVWWILLCFDSLPVQLLLLGLMCIIFGAMVDILFLYHKPNRSLCHT